MLCSVASAADVTETLPLEEQSAAVDQIEPREILVFTKSKVVTVGSNVVTVYVDYRVTYDKSNGSTWYIMDIVSARTGHYEGWLHVKPTATVSSYSYANNHQEASVVVTYDASVGAGYQSYTTTVDINTYDLG